MPKLLKLLHVSSLELSMLLEDGSVVIATTKPIRGKAFTVRPVLRRHDKRECEVAAEKIEPLLYRLTRKDEDPNKAA